MALLDVNWNPSRRDLRVFAGLQPVFWGLVAWRVWASGSSTAAFILLALGFVLAIVGFVNESLCRRLYVGWMLAVLPLGWIVSHVVMGIVFYLVLTPIGLFMRLLGRSPIPPGFDREAGSYWVRRPSSPPLDRYFRQF